MPSLRQVLVAILGLGLSTAGLSLALPATPAHAVGGVFISELHYDNVGTDVGEFVEVTAPAGTNLAAYSIVLYNGNGGATYTPTTNLSGVVTDQQDGWGTSVTDVVLQNGSPDGLALVNGGTVVEFLSYEGTFAAVGGPANTQTSTDIGATEAGSEVAGQSLQRQANNTWSGPAPETKGTPNGYDALGDDLAATAQGDVEATVGEAMDEVTLAATGGTPPYEWTTASTLPAGVSLSTDGVLGGTPTETGAFPITATVTDDVDGTDDVSFTLTVSEPAGPITIADVQGTGDTTPLANETITTTGVVTATYPTGGFNGFYLETPGEDTTPGASDGVFVYGGGASTFDESTLTVGDSVEVTGTAKEFSGLTEIELGASGTVTAVADLGDVVANPTIPGTDCALPGDTCLTGAALDAAKEEFEGEVFQPSGDYTVTDAYDGSAYNPPNSGSSSFFGEVGLAANSTEPLITPTEVIDAQATAAIAARVAYNNAHRVILDDGSSTTYWNTSNTAAGKDTPFPWFTPTHQVRVGAAATFEQPVILDFRFGWKVQPTSQVTNDGADKVSFEQNRPTQPGNVGGDIKIGTFNVLNYFTTLGVEYDAGPGSCTSFPDRAGNPIAVNSCTGNGPRGAWDSASFLRQQAKIVNAINALDADIVSVEEIENSLVVDGHNRDEAMSALVDALNADLGDRVWDYVHSPAEASAADNIAEQDVIRTGFIYKPRHVKLVGEADMLFDDPAFENAREPFAQTFKVAGTGRPKAFAVIVNHFKSKGSGINDGTGQGNANPDRVAQANALADFADDFATAHRVDAVMLTGDFNAYSSEDPVQVLEAAGYQGLQPDGKWSYSFDGQSGSLDHVFANDAAAALVSGVDIWEINANETVFNQYSRYNYNATNLYDESPFGASDHNPEIIGIMIGRCPKSATSGRCPTTPSPSR